MKNKLRSIALLTLFIFSGTTSAINAQSFEISFRSEETELTAIGMDTPVQTRIGDIDRDGITLDNLTFNGDNSTKLFYLPHKPIQRLIQVSKNGYALNFTEFAYDHINSWITFKDTPLGSDTISIDYEWSDDLDVMLLNQTGDTTTTCTMTNPCHVAKYTNNGTKISGAASLVNFESRGAGFEMADLNRDGWLDFVTFSTVVMVAIFDGVSSYNTASYNISGAGITDVDVGDVDGDGLLDIVTANSTGDRYEYLIQTTTGGFKRSQFESASALGHNRVELADIDNDGDLDAVFTHNNGNMQPHFFRNDGFDLVYTGENSGPKVSIYNPQNLDLVETNEPGGGTHGGVEATEDRKFYVIANNGNKIIEQRRLDTGALLNSYTFAGTEFLRDLALDEANNTLHLTDSGDNFILNVPMPSLSPPGAVSSSGTASSLVGLATDGFRRYATVDSTVPGADGIMIYSDMTPSSAFTFYNIPALSAPSGIDVDGIHIYWVDAANHMLYKADYIAPGTILASVGGFGFGNTQFDSPKDVRVFDNYVYVSDTNNNRFQIFHKSDLTYYKTISLGGSRQPWFFDLHRTPRFQYHLTSAPQLTNENVEFVDMDNDGDLDMLAMNRGAGFGSSVERIYLNNGAGNFGTLGWDIGAGDVDSGWATYGDYDSDGDFDLAFADESNGGGFKIMHTYLNNGGMSFALDYDGVADTTAFPTGVDDSLMRDVHIVDLNGDGMMEMVSASEFINGSKSGIAVWTTGAAAGTKITRITSTFTSHKSARTVTVIATYAIDNNDELGELIRYEIK